MAFLTVRFCPMKMSAAFGRRWPCHLAWILTLCLAGCDHSPFDKLDRSMDQAEQKQAAQDYLGAVNAYEHALDGTAKSADAHFRIGVIDADKLNDPVGAVHHFRRYLYLLPNGPHAREAKANLDRLELTLATNLAGGTLISHTEAMRLRTENADLRKQIAALRASAGAVASPSPGTVAGKVAARDATGKPAPGTRTYQVQPGDTLASISRKFYKNKARANDILDANHNSVPNATKLKPGQTLIMP